MPLDFEELDYQPTPFGDISLRRRREPRAGDCMVYEVKLGDDFLMSSLFTASEEALADLGLAALGRDAAAVVVGGLGLGHTAHRALAHPALGSLLVIEALRVVIDWHERALVPLGAALAADPRCRFVNADFFALAQDTVVGFDSTQPGRRFDAILLDIDHAPDHWLNPAHAAFYAADGLAALRAQLVDDGIFALWSNDPPDDAFVARLGGTFATVASHVVSFANPYTGGTSSCTVYVARCAPDTAQLTP